MQRSSLVLMLALAACTSGRGQSPLEAPEPGLRAAAAAHAQGDGMLDRVTDEDTRWVELPHFGQCPYGAEDIPPYSPVDDGDVPALPSNGTRASNEDLGDEALSNQALLHHLDRATAQVLTCVSVSACYETESQAAGEIDFSFEVSPDGQVHGVDVDTSAELEDWGVKECARRAIFDTTFPAYDGADMVVSYRLQIDAP